MADVKWIKFYVSILTNKKIKRIRKMPDGDTIALIWAFLLAQAGESNKDGGVYFNDEMPYSCEDFASDYDFKPKTVELAILTFERYGMIGVFDGIIYVKNWEKYQSVDGMEKIREQNRIRQAEFKERKRIEESNVIGNVSGNGEVTHGNATDIDIELDKDIDIKKKNSRFTPPTPEEVQAYCRERNNNVDTERFIDFYSSKGWMVGKNKMKDWKACVRTWEKENKPNQSTVQQKPKQAMNSFNQFPQRIYSAQDYADIERKLANKRL